MSHHTHELQPGPGLRDDHQGHGHGDDHHHDHDHDHGGWFGRLTAVFRPHSHDSTESVDSALESSAQGIRAVTVSLVALAVTGVLQLVVALASSSVGLLADTVHNMSDALTALPLWIAFVVGRRPADRRYTYGYGRAEDLAGLFIVAMIALSAVIAGVEAVRRLVHPAPVAHLGWVALAGLIGFAGNELVAVYRIRVGRRIGSAALEADGVHARTDGITSLAVLVGAGGVALGFPLADPIVGLLITATILAVLRTTVRDVYRRLMDAVDPALVDRAEAALLATPGITGVRGVRMRWIGHALHAEADLDIDGSVSVTEAHRLAHDAEERLITRVPRLRSAAIHAYPVEGDAAPPS